MQNWNVSWGKRNGGPFDTTKLRRSIDTGKLSHDAFVQAIGASSDWQQISTVESLVDCPQSGEPGYCLECDCRAIVAADSLGRSIRCPECGTIGPFVNYLDERTTELIGVAPEPWGKYDVVTCAFAGVLVLLILCGSAALLFNPSLSLLLGFITLVCGAGLFTITFQHRSESSKYRKHLTRVEADYRLRSDLLASTSLELAGLQRNLKKVRDDLVSTTEQELSRKRRQIDDELAIARDQHNAVHRMAERFLTETRKWWTTKLNGENYQLTKERISKAIEFCRKQGYVISNVGSFGENGFKVGLTRRLDPLDRVKELGDASVPFPFDVHMMIHSEDAPTLERKLHHALHKFRMNRVNFRKEFFRVDLETIRTVVEEHHGEVQYWNEGSIEESEYEQSLRISDADFAYLASISEAEGLEDEDDDLDGADEVMESSLN